MNNDNEGHIITGRRKVDLSPHDDASSHQVTRVPAGEPQIVSRRKIDFSESSHETISTQEALPPEFQKILEQLSEDVPQEWREQAEQAAHFIWSLEENKQIVDENGNPLEEKRERFINQLANCGFIWAVYTPFRKGSVDPEQAIPSWLHARKENKGYDQLTAEDHQKIKEFYEGYVQTQAKERISKDGQRYFHFEEGVPPVEETFAGTHRSKGYIEGKDVGELQKVEQFLLDLRNEGLHPHVTKLFDKDRLVLYWDSRLTDEQKARISQLIKEQELHLRAFAQDVPAVELNDDGYKVETRASNDRSLGEGGNPFQWEEKTYQPDKFLRQYLRMTYWGCKDPSEPYRLSFIPIITDKLEDLDKETALVKEVQEKIAETDKLPTLVTQRSYFDCIKSKF